MPGQREDVSPATLRIVASTKGPGVMPGQNGKKSHKTPAPLASTKGPGVMPGQFDLTLAHAIGLEPQRRDRALCPVRAFD